MKYFKKNEIRIKDFRTGKDYTLIFPLKKEHPGIENILTSCGCSNPRYDAESNSVIVEFRKNYVSQFAVTRSQIIVVTFDDGGMEKLKILY